MTASAHSALVNDYVFTFLTATVPLYLHTQNYLDISSHTNVTVQRTNVNLTYILKSQMDPQ